MVDEDRVNGARAHLQQFLYGDCALVPGSSANKAVAVASSTKRVISVTE